MRTAREWLWRLFAGLRRRRLETEMEEELRAHLELQAEAAIAQGVTPKEAWRQARLRAGSVAGAMEEMRDQRGLGWLDGSVTDIRQATAGLRRRPGFAALAAGALALSVAAGTLIFAILEGVVLRPLPYPEPERLVRVFLVDSERRFKGSPSIGDYLDVRRESRTLQSIGLYTRQDVQLMHGETPERLTAVQVTDDFFPTLGVLPAVGRNFERSELRAGARVAILSHRLWTSRFDADETIVGRTIRVNREQWTVIGVMPAGFQHIGGTYRSPLQGDTVQLWTPLNVGLKEPPLRAFHFTNAVARLKRGVSLQPAAEELRRISDDLARRYPIWNEGATIEIFPLAGEVVGNSRGTVWLVTAAGVFVLLIACANLAGLCIARGLARRREMAVRQALGAPVWRLVRVILSENVVLGMAGGVAGLLLSIALLPVLHSVLPDDFPRAHEIGLSWAGVAFALGAAIATSMAAGLLAAFRQAVRAPSAGLQQQNRATSPARQATRLRSALVITEIALASVLAIGSVLLLRSSQRLNARSHGFDPRGSLTFQLSVPRSAYPKQEEIARLYAEILRRWTEIPGVRAAGLTTNLPWSGYNENTSFDIVGRTPRPGERVGARYQAASAGVFDALGIRILEGRPIDDRDTVDAEPVIVINRALARRFFEDGSPIGRYIDVWGAKRRIIGVTDDVRDWPADAEAEPAFWMSMAQQPFSSVWAVVKTDGDPFTFTAAARNAVHTVDRELPVAEVRTMQDAADEALAERRFAVSLLEGFAMLATGMAVFGIYGLLSYVVQQRRKEVGIRLALGATRARIALLLVRSGAVLGVAGTACGVLLAAITTRGLAPLLYEVKATDPVTFALVPVLVLLFALGAAVGPAVSAARTNPAQMLHEE